MSPQQFDNGRRPNVDTPQTQSQDYNALPNFTRFYLDTYYRVAPTIDEVAINQFIIKELRGLDRRFDNCVEISGEGGIHHLIPIAPWVNRLHSTDFREEAREETRKWALGTTDAFSWDHYVAMSLRHEGLDPSEDAVEDRVAEIRNKIERIEGCNVLNRPIVDLDKIPFTPTTLTVMFFVSGEVGETVEGWKKVMENFCGSIAPGGHVIITALRGMREYAVHRPDGTTDTYPCAELYGDHFRKLLPTLGFPNPTVEELEIAEPDVGLKGIIMISATKSNG